MVHDLLPWRSRLLNSDCYVATPHFPDSFIWYSQKTGHIVIENESKKNVILAVVGKVLENRMDCEGHGTFRNWSFQTLPKAKYQLLLGKPCDTPFKEDFDIALDHISTLQGKIATGTNRQNFIVEDGGETALRFTHDIFEKRQLPVKRTCTFEHYEVLTNPLSEINAIDLLTDLWPVQSDYQSCLDDIKLTHCTVPLRIYVDGKAIGIHDAVEILRGAVVELQFELQHFPIVQKNLHSFNASIQQIQVLRPGEARPPTAFKRKNLSEGPIDVPESNTFSKIDDPSTENHPHAVESENGTFLSSTVSCLRSHTVIAMHDDFENRSVQIGSSKSAKGKGKAT